MTFYVWNKRDYETCPNCGKIGFYRFNPPTGNQQSIDDVTAYRMRCKYCHDQQEIKEVRNNDYRQMQAWHVYTNRGMPGMHG